MTEVEDYEAWEETAALPDQAPTQARMEAWSEALAIDDEPHRRPWRAACSYAVLILAVLGVVAFAIAKHPWNETHTTTKPTPTAAPAPPPPAQTPDDRFIELLKVNYPSGYPFDAAPAGIIKGGHWVCEYLGENHSTDDTLTVLDDERKSVPDAAARHQMSEDWLESSLTVYCPEFRTPQTRDDAFVAALKAIGMSMKNGSQDFSPLITSAHDVCQLLNNGQSRSDIVNSIYSVHTEGETKTGAENFVAASIKYYCPQYNG
jgi:hypothetical protein